MEVGTVFQYVASAFIQVCGMKFYMFGFELSIATIFIWSGIALIVIKFLRGLLD